MTQMANMTQTAADDGEVTALLRALVDTRAELFEAMRPLHIRYLQNDIVALQRQLALLFGERRGWRLSRSDFSPTVLAREGVFDGRGVTPSPGRTIWSIMATSIVRIAKPLPWHRTFTASFTKPSAGTLTPWPSIWG